MRKMVINTYFSLQIFLVIWGLIHLELALAGTQDGHHPSLWYLVLIKSTIILAFGISSDFNGQLISFLYGPQLCLDLLYLVSPYAQLSLVFILLGYFQLRVVIFSLSATWPNTSETHS